MSFMNEQASVKNNQDKEWQRVDARILGQILAAQNILFVLPDEMTIAEYFSQALSELPGVVSCYVCLEDHFAPSDVSHEACSDCIAARKKENDASMIPLNFSCRLSTKQNTRVIRVATHEHAFGFYIFKISSGDIFEPYIPFINNLANFVALSLENRMNKLLLEKSRDDLESRVSERTEELLRLNLQIHTLNQDLEKRVADRTAQLETANKELESFAYSVSHDLRAPLRSIDGFSQLLLEEYEEKVDAEGKNYLHKVRSATQRMAQLIDDLLNLSRISRHEIDIQQVDLSKMCREIANGLRESQPERIVEFSIQDGVLAQGDGHLLRIVLENLIGNAWKFTSKHAKAKIEFGTKREKEKVVYFIRDDGAGFDMNFAEKLFGAFQRLHTNQEFPGTGIGLATVQRIIHRHGGTVWAEGEIENLHVGKAGGATFYFTIP